MNLVKEKIFIMKKEIKQAITIAVIILIAVSLISCGSDSPSKPPVEPTCNCPNGTVHTDAPCVCEGKNCDCKYEPVKECECPEGTTHEPGEDCCEGVNCECEVAEPAVRNFSIELFEDNTATIQDARTKAGSKTLEQLGVTSKIETAINAAFDAGNNPAKNRFRGVFGDSGDRAAKIIIESNVTYESYEPDNRITLRFNFDYLSTVSAADLQTAITAAVTTMHGLLPPTLAKGKALTP